VRERPGPTRHTERSKGKRERARGSPQLGRPLGGERKEGDSGRGVGLVAAAALLGQDRWGKRKARLGPRPRRKGRWATGGEMEWVFGPEQREEEVFLFFHFSFIPKAI